MIDMFIPGEPAPGGSKTALPMRNRKYPGVCNHYLHKDGRLVLNYKDNGGSRKDPVTGKNDIGAGNREWRAAVEMGTKRRYCAAPLEGPLRVLFRFMVRRPQGQHVANDRARPVREDHQHLIGPIVAPDLTKYIRSTEDALTDAGLWKDDSQVLQQYAGEALSPVACTRIVDTAGVKPPNSAVAKLNASENPTTRTFCGMTSVNAATIAPL